LAVRVIFQFISINFFLYFNCLVLHPAGNVAEHLVSAGLARVVDWHAGMLASGGAMERLRAAEKSAKDKRACLYASIPTASAAVKSNGGAGSGQSRDFDATVIRIWSGDQISVIDKDTKKERRLQLSSTRGPKYIILMLLANTCNLLTNLPLVQTFRPKTIILCARGKGILTQETHR
jgi:endonuclease YncB( thermonuclease family)